MPNDAHVVGFWDDVKRYGGDAVQVGTLGAYNPNGGGWLQPSQGSTQPVQQAGQNALGLQRRFGALTTAFDQNNMPGANGAVANNAAGQNANIAMLQKYATGQMPSAAEMMLHQQGANNAANAYGTAAALGARTPGASLDSALRAGNVANQNAGQQAGLARVNEQLGATNALTSALGQQQSGALGVRGQNLGFEQDLMGNTLGASGQNVSAATGQVNANETNAATKNNFYGGIIGGAGSALGAYAKTSDEREKTDIHQAGGGQFDQLAEALKGFTFDYKHPGAPGESAGPQFGVMAQDAQKGGPAGQALVRKGTDGILRLDPGNAMTAALAMSAEALRRSKKGGGSGSSGAPMAA